MSLRSTEIRFDSQVVLVSGAGRGIGRCHALLFAERGAHVVVNDVDRDVAESVVAEIEANGGTATASAGDVVDDASAIVRRALDSGGRLDALVNNAGIAWEQRFGVDTPEATKRLLHVHALGTVALTAAAWDALLSTRGRVVNTTSGAVAGLLHSTAYAAAKGAVLGFTRSLAIEGASVGVRVNAVMPMARTRMFEFAGGEPGSAEDAVLSEYFPPERVAPTVVFLASDAVPFSGQVIETSGGSSAFVHFAVTPFVPTPTPEAARAALESVADALTIVHDLPSLLAAKIALSTADG